MNIEGLKLGVGYGFNRLGALDYVLVFLFLKFSLDPFFTLQKFTDLIMFFFMLLLFVFNRHKFDKKLLALVTITTVLITLQGIFWGFNLFTLFTYIAIVVVTPYFLHRIIGVKVFVCLVNIIYFFSITSLILWALQNFNSRFDDYLYNLMHVFFEYSFDLWPRSLIFYTVSLSKVELANVLVYRNSGIFHEPGAYALWLILAMGINTIISERIVNKKNIVFVVALVTTFSTAGYVQLFVLLMYFILKLRVNVISKVIVLVAASVFSYQIYTSASFLENKIEQHYQEQSSLQLEGSITSGRFVRIMKIFSVIEQSPFFGRGIITASAVKDVYSQFHMSGTGSLKVIGNFGVIFGFLFFFFYLKGIKSLCYIFGRDPSISVFFLGSLFIGGLSQDFFVDAISSQFFFLGLIGHNFFQKKSLNLVPKKKSVF